MKLRALLSALLFACTPVRAAPSNHFRFSGEINPSTVDAAISTLSSLARPGSDFIVMEINSRGGYVDAGFELAKAIESSPVPVVCVVDGEAASMAFYVLQSCAQKYMTNRSVLLMHKPSSASFGPVNGNDDFYEGIAEWLRKLNGAMVQHYANHMKIPAKQIAQRIAHRDWIMDPDEALRVGAVDGVVKLVSEVTGPTEPPGNSDHSHK